MRIGQACRSILSCLLLASGAGVAHASRPAPDARPLPSAPQRILVGERLGASVAACPLGVTDLPHLSMNYLYPPEDAYYTLLEPEACGCVGGNSMVSVARVVLDFPEECALPVSVGIVSADLSDPACPVPQAGAYLCAPVEFTLTPAEPGIFEFELPFGGGCAISERAFLVFTVHGQGECASLPSLVVDFDIAPCFSYNDWPGGAMTDLYGYLLGNPNMSVLTSCGSVVPTTTRSWGELKTIYR